MTSSTRISIPTDAGEMPAHRYDPQGNGPAPALVVLQEIFGVSAYIRSRATDLADLGYLVIVPEIFWRLDDVVIDEESPELLQQGMATLQRLDWDRAVADAAAATRFARTAGSSDGRVGIVGFCFGGGLGFASVPHERPDALVSYYGSALPDLLGMAPQVDVPSLHHFGDSDSFVPLETVQKIRDAVTQHAGVEFHLYPGADHAFDGTSLPDLHHREASALAWQRSVEFLGRTLPANR